jgi:penicillin-binding protein 2
MLLGPGRDPVRRDRPIRTGRRDRPVIQLPSVALRVAALVGLAALLFGIILFRLWFLQVLSGQEYVAKANDNRLSAVKLVAPRGAILDRNGHVIVTNRPGNAVGIRLMDVPKGSLDTELQQLAPILRKTPAELRGRIKDYLRPSTLYLDGKTWKSYLTWKKVADGEIQGLDLISLKDDVSRKVYSYLLEHTMSFPGVEIQHDYLRAYPQGDLAAHLLGQVREISAEELGQNRFKGYQPGDIIGAGGVEYTYDQWLRGRDGIANFEVDAFNRPKSNVPQPGSRLPQAGDSLMLTIDDAVQKKAQEALQYGIQVARNNGAVSANGGAAVVLDAKSGQVIAMASNPTYSPKMFVGGLSKKQNKRLQAKRANVPLLNRAIQEQKAVGSTFKVIDAVAGLEEGVISPSTTFFCPGSFKVAGTTFNCWYPAGHGSVSLVPAITESCDVYFYNIGYHFYLRSGTELEDWAMRLGMNKPTGIDIPGEAAGRVPTPGWKQRYFKTEIDKLWKPGDSINLAIGQGNLEATPLQLAVTYAAVANGGYRVTPHVGLKVVTPQGKLVRTITAPKPKKLDISAGTLDVVRQGLRDAASAVNGTSTPVFGAYPVAVAGKTGTAQVFGQSDYAWYASYAPANDPKYVVVVMIEQGGHGGTSAAPAARMIYDSLFKVKSGAFSGTVNSD